MTKMFMRKFIGLSASLLFLFGCQQPAPTQAPAEKAAAAPAAPAQSPVERGKYLTTVGGCNDCHTPKKMGPNGPEADMTRELSGNPSTEKVAPVPAKLFEKGWLTLANNHLGAWAGPWGVSFAMNLTPDKETGLGSWTPEMFMGALRTGKHQGTGRPILPPMPWNWYRNMTDDDLKAIFAYLQSLPPIKNPIPDPLPPDKIPTAK
jgi:mono/diheme cytochrome c family protein